MAVENWQILFTVIVFGAVVNFAIAFVVMRALSDWQGISPEVNTGRNIAMSLLTIIPAAGVCGAPFFLIPFMGPIFGVFVSSCVAPMLLADRYEITQLEAAKIIIPTVLVVAAVSAMILYYGLPAAL